MASGRGGHQEGGRGRTTPGRGGRFGTPPPPPGGRGFTPARGRGPSTFYGGGGRGGPGLGYSPSPQRPGRGQRGSPAAAGASPGGTGAFVRGRGAGPGRGAAAAGGSPGGYAVAHSGLGGGKLFGRGQEAVAYDREKEKGVLKVGPPPGQRFSATWLRGLTHFVAWRQQQQAQEAARQPRQRQQQQPAAVPPPPPPSAREQLGAGEQQQDGEGPAGSAGPGATDHPPRRPPVTVQRLGTPEASSGSTAEATAAAAAAEPAEQVAEQLGEMGLVDETEEAEGEGSTPAEAAAGPHLSPESSAMGGGDSDLNEEADLLAAGRSGASTPASTSGGSEDLGWASVLLPAAAAAAAAAASDQGSSAEGEQQASNQRSEAQQQPSAGSPSTPATEGVGSREHSGEPCSPGSRGWWPPSPPSLSSAQPVAVDERPAEPADAVAASGGQVALSLRLERMQLTDREAGMLADWCCEHAAVVDVKKLWLFDNRLGDEGAAAVARILQAHPGMLEIHLSHNMLTLRGAAALLEALPVQGAAAAEPTAAAAAGAEGAAVHEAAGKAAAGEPATAGGSEAAAGAGAAPLKPVWLRLEWNRISLGGLMQALEEQHQRRGLLVDLPTAVRPDAAPSLPDLPPYLAAAAARAPAAPTSAPASRGARNALQFVIDRCHARLPWVSCQYQQPSEAQVLKAARSTWQAAAQQQQQQAPSAEPAGSAAPAAAASPAAAAPAPAAGPLLLFPDTSALLPMLGAGERVALPTFFTLELLEGLAKAGRFGRALPPQEQVFLVVTDSVLKQLDGLKNDPGARPAVRRFLGQFLDLCGPAGHDFLTVLGAHEGEGLLVEHDAAVAGSRSADTKGQRTDHRIVEVALFFQQEVAGRASRLTAAAFPVLLLSGDNTQVQTGRSHGLPAARMADLAAAQAQLEAALAGSQPLTASLLRACLGAAAVTGLGSVAARSLQAEFDDAVAALQLATEALSASRQQLGAVAAAAAGEGTAEEVLAAVQQTLAGAGSASSSSSSGDTEGDLLPALQARLAEWQQRVVSHQDPSRLLRWAGGKASGSSTAGGSSSVD